MNNQLQVLRVERNWSKGELSHLLGVSRQAVKAIETCKYVPSLNLAFKIAQLFQTSIEELFLSL